MDRQVSSHANHRATQTRKHSPTDLPETLEKHLYAYAAAAGAAGVAILACATPAEAKVVSKQVNIPIPINGGIIQFDINGDGQNDFGLSAIGPTTTCTLRLHVTGKPPLGCPFNDRVNVIPAQAANEVWQVGSSYGSKCAADLAGGAKVGAGRPFGTGKMLMGAHSGTSIGHYICQWVGPEAPRPYLGVKFSDTSGNVHFGWVRVSVIGDVRATITAYGYETIPNKPILAGATRGSDDKATLIDPIDLLPATPQVASLGRLAQGSSGIPAWRRVEESAAQ